MQQIILTMNNRLILLLNCLWKIKIVFSDLGINSDQEIKVI